MRKEQVDLANKLVFIADSKTPTGVAEVPLSDIAGAAFKSQLEIAGPGPWLFPSPKSPAAYQTKKPELIQQPAQGPRNRSGPPTSVLVVDPDVRIEIG